MHDLEELVLTANAALQRGDPSAAIECLELVPPTERPASAFEALGLARYLLADYDAAVAAYAEAYARCRREADGLAAGRSARILAWITGNVFGDWAVRSGWIARARTLLADAPEQSAEAGWVLMLDAENVTDAEAKTRSYRRALELGRRFGDVALEVEARGWLGLQTALAGDVDGGLQLLDEALASVVSGEVTDVYVVEGTFCGLFWACERFHDVHRVQQWVRAAETLQQRRHIGAAGFCRAHYGGILTAAGRWKEADAQLTEAARLFERGYAALKASVEVRLAELRVLQGRLEEADQLLRPLTDHPDAVRPLAMLYLAFGHLSLAREVLERRLAEDGLDHDVAAPLLGLLIDVELAQEDCDAAAQGVARLERAADARPSVPFIAGTAALAKARLCVATGEPEGVDWLRRSISVFERGGASFQAATARLELARALQMEAPEVAMEEAAVACETYRRLGATGGIDAAEALLRTLGGRTRSRGRISGDLTAREVQVLELLGAGLSNVEIADRLYLSRKTVEHHVSRVLMKLGLRNRAEAASFVARGGKTREGPGSGS